LGGDVIILKAQSLIIKKMNKFLIVVVLIFLASCDQASDKAKAYCAGDWRVVSAKTDKAAQLGFEACLIEQKKRMKNK